MIRYGEFKYAANDWAWWKLCYSNGLIDPPCNDNHEMRIAG